MTTETDDKVSTSQDAVMQAVQDSDVGKRAEFVQRLIDTDGTLRSPVNLQIKNAVNIDLPLLKWVNYDVKPGKMKLTNTGHTVILSAKWGRERPYIAEGPLSGTYVFSQIHFHWGETDLKGSEHQIEGESLPMEIHVVHFKTKYLTQESSLREKDGLVVLVYFFQLQDACNEVLKPVTDQLHRIKNPHTSVLIDPIELTQLIKTFESDYLFYWGSVMTASCAHVIQWFICRKPIGVSSKQIEMFRQINDSANEPLLKNYLEVQPMADRKLFHVLPSDQKDFLLLN